MSKEFKYGLFVEYSLPNEVNGIGKVVGYATLEIPCIGRMWILEDVSGNFPNNDYHYTTFSCPESYISDV